MIKKERYPHGGFTLIELLVVVLIIGILAAIALPKYQMAIGKAKFAGLKTSTQIVVNAAQRYYLLHNKYPVSNLFNNLDIEAPSGDIACATAGIYLLCVRNIFGVSVAYYVLLENSKPKLCYVDGSSDVSHPANILCIKDGTDRIPPTCKENRCIHYYH